MSTFVCLLTLYLKDLFSLHTVFQPVHFAANDFSLLFMVEDMTSENFPCVLHPSRGKTEIFHFCRSLQSCKINSLESNLSGRWINWTTLDKLLYNLQAEKLASFLFIYRYNAKFLFLHFYSPSRLFSSFWAKPI